MRINLGNTLKFYFEQGVFAAVSIFANEKGIRCTQLLYKEQTVIEFENSKAFLTLDNLGLFTGMGISFPFRKYRMFIQPEFRLGIRKLLEYEKTAIRVSFARLGVGIEI